MTFKVKSSLRILEDNDEIILPSICEVKNSVKESSDDLNIVDYECISNNSNNTNWNNYELDIINEGEKENEGLLKKSNIKEISKNITKKNIIKKKSLYKLKNKIKNSLLLYFPQQHFAIILLYYFSLINLRFLFLLL